jgi:putative addiction module component (TIGR02574 family)
MLTVENIIEEALKKGEDERAKIVDALIFSLHEQSSIEIEEAWKKEIEKRIKQIDSGEVQCISWEEVRSRLYKNANV